MVARKHIAHHTRELLMVLSLIIHEDARDVSCVVKIAHGAERDRHQGIVVIVSALHLVLEDSDYLKAHAINSNALPQRLLARKKSPLRLVANHNHPSVFQFILIAQPPASGHVEAANALVHRIDTRKKKIGVGPRVMLDRHAALVKNRSDPLHHRHFVADEVNIRQFQSHFGTSLGTARL